MINIVVAENKLSADLVHVSGTHCQHVRLPCSFGEGPRHWEHGISVSLPPAMLFMSLDKLSHLR